MREIEKIYESHSVSDGAGVKLRRSIGVPGLDVVDPFLLLDEFYSDDPNDYLAGFPNHPHRGFETVTYMLAGRMRHRDNVGNAGVIEPLGAQWMTAGRGIIHSEMPEQDSGLMRGLQLWINLPAARKMTDPGYQEFDAQEIPEREMDGAKLRILAGQIGEIRGPVTAPDTNPVYLDISLLPGKTAALSLPEGHTGLVYVLDGGLQIGENRTDVAAGQLGLLTDGKEFTALSETGARFLLLAGAPLNEPVVRYGPFVMNRREEIEQAVKDYQTGRF